MIIDQSQLKKNRRNQRINNIKLTLTCMPIFKHIHPSKLVEKKSLKTADIITSQASSSYKQQFQQHKDETPSILKPKLSKCFTDLYTFGQKIGEGAHGVVKKCSLKDDIQVFAVKTIRLDMEHILFLKENFLEIKKLKHKNIIGYKALFLQQKKQQCHLVMEYLPYPDLLSIHIKDQRQLQEIVYQILTALAYLHSQGICHRDIKPQNILYDQTNRNIKIIDFGISKKLTKRNIKKDMLTQTGTLYYRAPEMFEGGGYDERIDLWALGVTIFKLMTGSTPFESVYLNQTITNILKGEFSFPVKAKQTYCKAARNLVYRLIKHKQERLTANEALLDLWLMDFYQNADQLTHSLTHTKKSLRIFGKAFIITQNLFRTQTNQKRQYPNEKGEQKSTDEILKGLKLQDLWNQQQNNIYEGEEQTQQQQI